MKSHVKKLLIIGALAVVCIAGFFWFDHEYVVLNGEIYNRSVTEVILSGDELPDQLRLSELEHMAVLDIREIPVQPEQYEQLRTALPECEILWKVPFGNDAFDNTSKELRITSLTDKDLQNLIYFSDLQSMDAQGCDDYDMLLAMKELKPELNIMYTVNIGENEVRENTTSLTIRDGEASQLLDVLAYLPDLEKVDALECSDYDSLVAIDKARPELMLEYVVPVNGKNWPGDTTQMTLEDVDAQELTSMLPYLPYLTDVYLTGITPDNYIIYEMMCTYPKIIFHWDFELFGVETSSTASTLILSGIRMKSTDEVEEALKYFYNLERVEMCECGISSEDMDALWKRHPETRFVWTVRIGGGTLRTDATAFIPFKIGYNIDRPFYDSQIKELKYCIDLECLDLGHMRMTDISFLQYMPKMKFLILADVVVEDFSVLAGLTELVYLELFRSYFNDVELLLNMKKLECLNIGWTDLDNPELLKEMTWLKRLWVARIGTTYAELQELKKALPDTYVYIDPLHPTEGGWRQCDRYYEMRDLLGMHYMK